jgi:hypothetical protein
MKYLAILRDSVREAIDAKVLYVMLAISGAIIAVCLMISFKPRPAADLNQTLEILLNVPLAEQAPEMRKMVAQAQLGQRAPDAGQRQQRNGFGLFGDLFKTPPSVTYAVRSVEPLGGAPDQPSSPFVFTVRARFAKKAEADKAGLDPAALEQTIRERFAALGPNQRFLDVTEVRPADPDNKLVQQANPADPDLFFEVQTRPNHSTRAVWPSDPYFLVWQASFIQTPQGDAFPLGMQVLVLADLLANSLGATVILLVSIVLTSLFIPNMLRKGTIDLLLVKPIRRWALLLYKYIGGLTFILINITVLMVGIWLVFGLRSGLWVNSLLLTIPVLILVFATLYAVSTLCAVGTRSAIVAILLSCLVWGALLLVDYTNRIVQQLHKAEEIIKTPPEKQHFTGVWVDAIAGVHRVLPRYRDMVVFTSQKLEEELVPQGALVREEIVDPIDWQQSLLVSGAYLAGLLALSCAIFSLRDY